MRVQFGSSGFFKRVAVGTMGRIEVVQTATTGHKATTCFCVVNSMNKSHVLAHAIAMEVRWAEGVFRHHPARRENYEIHIRSPRRVASGSQYRENGRIWMIKTDRVDGIELTKIIFIGDIITVPGNNVQRRVVHFGTPPLIRKFSDQFEFSINIFKSSVRSQKMTPMRQPIGTDRSQLRKTKRGAKIFSYVT